MNNPTLLFIFGLIATIAALLYILEYFGIKPSAPIWGLTMPLNRNWKLATMLSLVAISLWLSGAAFYKSRHPKIVERFVEKPVDRIVPGDCPKGDSHPATGKDKKPKPTAEPKTPPISEVPKPQPPSQNCPNGICIGGENSGNPTVNNFGPLVPDVTWSLENKAPHPNAKDSDVCVKISINRTFMDPKFAVVCDRPCKGVWGDSVSPHGGAFDSGPATIPDRPEVAAFVVNSPNPMPVENSYLGCVESTDNNPVRIVDVKTLVIRPKQQ